LQAAGSDGEDSKFDDKDKDEYIDFDEDDIHHSFLEKQVLPTVCSALKRANSVRPALQ
jgi:hypothetical protein